MITTTKRITAITAVFTLMLVATHSVANADERIKPSPMAKVTQGLNPKNWKLPKWKMPDFSRLIPGGEKKKAPAREMKKRGSMLEGVSKTASNSWNKTKQVFDAEKLNPMKYLPASSKGKSKEAKSKPGFFRSLWGTKEQQPAPATPTDFLRLDRPGM